MKLRIRRPLSVNDLAQTTFSDASQSLSISESILLISGVKKANFRPFDRQWMANPAQGSNYKQRYSSQTIAAQQAHTAELKAAFLLPYMKETDSILVVGCGPGTITIGLAK